MSFFINNRNTVFFRNVLNFLMNFVDKNYKCVYYYSCAYAQKKCASGSVVEHLLAKEGVAGSIPVSRSFIRKFNNFLFYPLKIIKANIVFYVRFFIIIKIIFKYLKEWHFKILLST